MEAQEAEERREAQAKWEVAWVQERSREHAKLVQQKGREEAKIKREKITVEAKAREDAEYLKRHNKTVKQVLSQAAKHNRRAEDCEQTRRTPRLVTAL